VPSDPRRPGACARSHLAAAITAALLAFPAVSTAAYAPKLDVKIDPTTPNTQPAVTSVITQAAGETANKTVKVAFPAGFALPQESTITPCTNEQEQARACPEGSKIGAAHATAPVLALPVQLDGTVNYGEPVGSKIKLIVFLDNAMLNQHLTIEGFVTIRDIDGGFDTTFDGLPNQETTSFTLALDGGTRSLLINPAKCGDYVFKGSFVSQNGEQATSDSTVTVSGCKPAPLFMSPVDLTPTHARRSRGTTLDFNLSEPAAVVITVKRAKRRVATKQLAGVTGTNTLKHFGRRYKPGKYSVKVVATSSDGQIVAHRATLTIKRG
jgi:hypothetical protein